MCFLILYKHQKLTILLKAAEVVRSLYVGKDVNFRVITLKEPPKNDMTAFLDHEQRKLPAQWTPIRCARVEIMLKTAAGENELHEIHVDLDKRSVVNQQVLKGKHSYIDSGYMKEVENACMADQRVRDEIKKLDLPAGASVVVEPWAYATDGQNDMSKRVTMVRTHVALPAFRSANLNASAGSTCVYSNIKMRTTTHTH